MSSIGVDAIKGRGVASPFSDKVSDARQAAIIIVRKSKEETWCRFFIIYRFSFGEMSFPTGYIYGAFARIGSITETRSSKEGGPTRRVSFT